MNILKKEIVYFGEKSILACDGKCNKAWGINKRPKIQLDANDEDDYAYLSDSELGDAPENPQTYEGSDGKPISNDEKLNKWCCRECERSYIGNILREFNKDNLPNFNNRVYNVKR